MPENVDTLYKCISGIPLHKVATDSATRTPNWMISIPKAQTTSLFRPNCTELFGWSCFIVRDINPNSVLNLYTSGSICHSELSIVLQNGIHTANLNKWAVDGTKIEKVIIYRLSRDNAGEIKDIQTLIFETCQVHKVISTAGHLSIYKIGIGSRENNMRSLYQDGTLKGQNTTYSYYDF